MGRQVPLGVLRVAHGPFAWRHVVVVLIPISDVFELYPWELGIVVLCIGVGLFELHSSACDSVSNVYGHTVAEVLELVNGVLWVAFVAFVLYGFVIGRIGVDAAQVWTHVEVPGGFRTLWVGAHLAGSPALVVVI